jgi:hypothetical protein
MRHWWDDDRKTETNLSRDHLRIQSQSHVTTDVLSVARSALVSRSSMTRYAAMSVLVRSFWQCIQTFSSHLIENNFHSTNQSFNAAQRNHHCFMWRIIRNTRTHCVGKAWGWTTPVIWGPEFQTYVEYLECRRASSAFRRGLMRFSLFWNFTKLRLVVWLRRFGTFRSHLQGPSSTKILEYGTDRLSRNVGNCLQTYAA